MKRNRWCSVIAIWIIAGLLVAISGNHVLAQEGPDAESGEEEVVGSEDGATAEDGTAEDGTTTEDGTDTDDVSEEETTVDEVVGGSFFTIETAVGTQSVINGKIPIYLYLKPKIDSSKAQLEWNVPRGLDAMSSVDVWFEMEEDTGRTFTLYVSPQTEGHYKIVVNVTAWRFDTNYVDSEEIEIDIDSDLLMTPQTAEYQRNNILLTVGIIVVCAAGVVGGYFVIKLLQKKFSKWMSED